MADRAQALGFAELSSLCCPCDHGGLREAARTWAQTALGQISLFLGQGEHLKNIMYFMP